MHQSGQAEVDHQAVPVGRIPQGRSGDHSAPWTDDEPVVAVPDTE